MPRSPIFIVGSPRSGTSILVDLMLAAGYHGYREGMFLSLMSGLAQAVDRHFSIFAQPGTQQVLISVVDQAALKRRIFEIFREVTEEKNSEEPWFDKTGNPEMIETIPILRELWPECGFIFAKRRGIENIASRIKKFPEHSFEYHCRDWAKNMAAWRRRRTELPEEIRREVDQQDMIQKPEAVADELIALLGVEPGRREPLIETLRSNRPQQTEQGSAARVKSLVTVGWTPQQTEVFLKLCEEEITAYGYSLTDSYWKRS
ncbi:MAG TPA: sulfotransferase [Crenalkalicoccus sp.]|jgi:hypothetical protein|nr:sulfotransferase [Crenalkalicoccus sp.]